MQNFKIKKIYLKDGKQIELKEDSIVIIIGANNTGKTTFLKDIYNKIANNNKVSFFVDNIETNYGKQFDAKKFLEENFVLNDNKYHVNASFLYNFKDNFNNAEFYTEFSTLIKEISPFLSTEQRLLITKPEQNIATKFNLIRKLFLGNTKLFSEFSQTINNTFGEHLHFYDTINVDLKIGSQINLSSNNMTEEERNVEYRSIIDSYKSVHDQGDGIKSYIGILLFLYYKFYHIYFLDEPENFLHKSQQISIVDEIINKTSDKQIFLTTHSEVLLSNFLIKARERIILIKIKKEEKKYYIDLIGKDIISNIYNEHYFQFSDVLSSLFCEITFICESESDCCFYSTLLNYLNQQTNYKSAFNFVQCNGKGKLLKIYYILKNIGIDVRPIFDLDIIKESGFIKNICKFLKMSADEIKNVKTIVDSILSQKPRFNKKEVLSKLSDLLTDDCEISKKSLINTVKTLYDFDYENNMEGIKFLIEIFDKYKFFICPEGELERFIPQYSNLHGNDFVDKVFEELPDFEDPIFTSAKQFLNKIIR